MKEYLEVIIELLNREYNFYQELENILIEERNALVNFDNDSLTELNFKKESLLLNIIEVKNKRDEILKEFSINENIPIDKINLTFLSNISKEYSDIFINFKDKFKRIGRKIDSLNEINKHVINSSLNFIKSSLNIIYQNNSRATYSSYGKVSGNCEYNSVALYTSKA